MKSFILFVLFIAAAGFTTLEAQSSSFSPNSECAVKTKCSTVQYCKHADCCPIPPYCCTAQKMTSSKCSKFAVMKSNLNSSRITLSSILNPIATIKCSVVEKEDKLAKSIAST